VAAAAAAELGGDDWCNDGIIDADVDDEGREG